MRVLEARTRSVILQFAVGFIPTTNRVWMYGHVLLTHNGTLYRGAADARARDMVFEEKTSCHMCDIPDDLPDLAKEYDSAHYSMGGAAADQFRKW